MLPGCGDWAGILRTIAELYCLGVRVDWRRLDAADARFVALGTYPWQRERCWFELSPPVVEAVPATRHAVLVPSWVRAVRRPDTAHSGPGDWLIVGDGGATASALAASLEAAGHTTRSAGARAGADTWDQLLAERSWRGVVQIYDRDPGAWIELEATVRLLQALVHDEAAPRWRGCGSSRAARRSSRATPTSAALARSTAWGLGRVAANEQPRLRCTLVDLPALDFSDVAALRAELLADDAELEVALRGADRYVARLARQSFTMPASRLALRADATYLVTGGLGALGLAAAQLLVEHGARHLVLLGRRGVTTALARTARSRS